MVLQSVPMPIQKRMVYDMIKSCNMKLSRKELEEVEKMYTPQEKWNLNRPIIGIMEILKDKIESGNDEKKCIKIVEDFIVSLTQHQFTITTRDKEQVAEIKHYTEKLEE